MKYFDIISILHSSNARYGDPIEIETVMNDDAFIQKYMNCDDSAIYFVDGKSIPLKNIESIKVLK